MKKQKFADGSDVWFEDDECFHADEQAAERIPV
jgi:hypothetical protein